MNSVIVWSIIFVLIALFAYYATRMARRDRGEEGLNDPGFALLEFGRAFPNEAVRELHSTADGKAVFIRLHDGKTGIMRSHAKHYTCYLIKPGRVRVQGQADACSLAVEFLDSPANNGLFTFRTETEAAEVSLWLLGTYVSSTDMDVAEDEA
ncbi:hypothetical protein ACWGPT_09140 [Pseudorhizobium sp. NPDC055634]